MGRITDNLLGLAAAAKRLAHAPSIDASVELCSCLKFCLARPNWLQPEYRHGNPEHYQRYLLHADPAGDFVITVIVWLPGQVSPVHGHRTWCPFGIVEGELVEQQFQLDAQTGKPVLIASKQYRPGGLADLDLDATAIHRVSNRSTTPVISLHIYGVPESAIATGINRVFV